MSEPKKVVIVGASAAGLRTACRLHRLRPEVNVTVLESREVFSYGACGLPYVLSGDIDNLQELHTTTFGVIRDEDFFHAYKGLDVRTGSRATSVDVAARTLEVESPDGPYRLEWDDLVLATGASARRLPGQPDHPRVRPFHSWDDVKPLKMGLMRGEIDHVAVVGAGLVGCELAEAFRSLWGADVTLVEAAETPLPEVLDPELGRLVASHLRESGVRLLMGRPVAGIEAGDDGAVVRAGSEDVSCDVVVVAVGVTPEVGLAVQAGVELSGCGAIVVDENLATSVPGVWAAGDCVACRHVITGSPTCLPLGSLANRQGRTLANVIAGLPDAFPGVVGSVAVKVLDWNVASAGCTKRQLRALGRNFKSMWITGEAAATYWPESEEIFLTLHYDPTSLQVLGVQAAGSCEVSKRIDVASQLMARGATLSDLAHLEHAYAPPYAPAIDPLAVIAMAALNQEQGIEAVSPLAGLDDDPVLDVRLEAEREGHPVDAATIVTIEMSEIADRLEEIPTGPMTVVCERGTRSAEVVRWLEHAGRSARYLGGGMGWRGKI